MNYTLFWLMTVWRNGTAKSEFPCVVAFVIASEIFGDIFSHPSASIPNKKYSIIICKHIKGYCTFQAVLQGI